MNKYIEKIAIFGFSREEKINKAHTKYYIDTTNSFADHMNPEYEKLNKQYGHLVSSGDPKQFKQYISNVKQFALSHKKLRQDFNNIHSEYMKKLKDFSAEDTALYHKDPDKAFAKLVDEKYTT